jgi:hypothetical protein
MTLDPPRTPTHVERAWAASRQNRPEGYAHHGPRNRQHKFHLCPDYPTTARTLCGRDLGVPGWGADWNALQTDWASQGRRCCQTCSVIAERQRIAAAGSRRPA